MKRGERILGGVGGKYLGSSRGRQDGREVGAGESQWICEGRTSRLRRLSRSEMLDLRVL